MDALIFAIRYTLYAIRIDMNKPIKLMEVCGTHTMAIARAGIKKLLPPHVQLISGPGCPVCVTDQADIDRALAIALLPDVIMTTFGDMMRVPGTETSLQEMKQKGADVRVVYSCMDALEVARAHPNKSIVFMGVGFETTSPTIAATILEAKRQRIKNFFILSNFKLLFPALDLLANSKKLRINGFICPGHVSVITGSQPYEAVARHSRKPCVITGFEASDILKGIELLLQQIDKSEYLVMIEYKRAVRKQGNKKALSVLNKVFKPVDAKWRGLGMIKKSGLGLRREFTPFSAEKKFKVKVPKPMQHKGCLCGEVIQGLKMPQECSLFKKACTPQRPVGACMVSSEGACAAAFTYGE